MLVDLISVTTSDEITLDGAFSPAATDASGLGPVDVMLLIHGSGGRFYAPATRTMAGPEPAGIPLLGPQHPRA